MPTRDQMREALRVLDAKAEDGALTYDEERMRGVMEKALAAAKPRIAKPRKARS